MFDLQDYYITLSSNLANEKLRANQAEHDRDKLYKALNECVRLLDSSLYITPDNSMAYKAKINSFKKILNEVKK